MPGDTLAGTVETGPHSDKSRLAAEVIAAWTDFQLALSDKRKSPVVEFRAFTEATRRYVAVTRHDALINRQVAKAVHGLVEFLGLERKRVPEQVLWEAERLECLLFSGYDPHFEGDEPPGL